MDLNCVGPLISGFFFNKYTAGPPNPRVLHLQIQPTQMENSFLWGVFSLVTEGWAISQREEPSLAGLESTDAEGPQYTLQYFIYKREISVSLCESYDQSPMELKGIFTVQGVSTPNSCIV